MGLSGLVQATALVVEPDVIHQKELAAALKQLGYEVMVTGVYGDVVQVGCWG